MTERKWFWLFLVPLFITVVGVVFARLLDQSASLTPPPVTIPDSPPTALSPEESNPPYRPIIDLEESRSVSRDATYNVDVNYRLPQENMVARLGSIHREPLQSVVFANSGTDNQKVRVRFLTLPAADMPLIAVQNEFVAFNCRFPNLWEFGSAVEQIPGLRLSSKIVASFLEDTKGILHAVAYMNHPKHGRILYEVRTWGGTTRVMAICP